LAVRRAPCPRSISSFDEKELLLIQTLARRAGRALLPSSQPNVVPFIDVLLVLLVIFMITAPKPTTDLNVDLPGANNVRGELQATIVEVRTAPGGYLLAVNNESVAFAELGARVLAHAVHVNPGFDARHAYALAPVIVRADQDIAYAHVVTVLDALRDARFSKVGIFAEQAA
jgi:biopolymer transport protein ExbD